MPLTPGAAALFLLAVAPICFYVAFSDLARMKIPNIATDALALAYVVIGPFALPFDLYLWGYVHFVVMLLAGIVLNAAGAMGGGDSKFLASAAPYVQLPDILLILVLLPGCLIGGYITHKLAKHTALRRMVPHWASWDQDRKRFPMGFPFSLTLVGYLVIVVVTR